MIIFLTGPNDFAVKQALDSIKARFVAKFGDAGLERLSGDTLEPRRLSEVLQGASLFSAHRLVILRDVAANKPLWEALGDWLERVPVETTLVVAEPAADKRTRTYKQLKKLADCQEFNLLQPPELQKWLQKTAVEQGGNIDAKAAAHLVQKVGADQWRLWQELNKLIGHGDQITVAVIDDLVDATPQANAFDLLDAALGRKNQTVGQLLDKLSAVEDAFRLFGLLVSQVHTLAIVQSASGKSPDAIAKEAGIHPFVVRKMQPVARGMGDEELRGIIQSLSLLDTQLKSTGIDPWLLLGQCLQKIASR